MSAEYVIEVERGTDLRLDLVAKHADDTPYDLTEVTATLFTCADEVELEVGPEAGTIHVHLAPLVTGQIDDGSGYRIDLEWPGGDIQRLLRGRMQVLT